MISLSLSLSLSLLYLVLCVCLSLVLCECISGGQVITKDSNVLVVALAGNMVTGFAKGLRTNFQNYASPVSQ